MNYRENPSGGSSKVVSSGRTDRHDEANNRLSQFAIAPKNWKKKKSYFSQENKERRNESKNPKITPCIKYLVSSRQVQWLMSNLNALVRFCTSAADVSTGYIGKRYDWSKHK